MFLSQFTLHTFNFSSHLLLPTHGSPGCAWPVTVTAFHFSSCPWHSKRDSPCWSFGRPSLPSRNVPEEQWDGPSGRSCPRCEVPPQCGEVLSSIGFDYLHDWILSTDPYLCSTIPSSADSRLQFHFRWRWTRWTMRTSRSTFHLSSHNVCFKFHMCFQFHVVFGLPNAKRRQCCESIRFHQAKRRVVSSALQPWDVLMDH